MVRNTFSCQLFLLLLFLLFHMDVSAFHAKTSWAILLSTAVHTIVSGDGTLPLLICCYVFISCVKWTKAIIWSATVSNASGWWKGSSEKLKGFFCFLVMAELRICLVLSGKLFNSKLSLVKNAAAAQLIHSSSSTFTEQSVFTEKVVKLVSRTRLDAQKRGNAKERSDFVPCVCDSKNVGFYNC